MESIMQTSPSMEFGHCEVLAEHARAIHPAAASTSQRAKQFLNLPITRYF
jgi:hypothetical protein